MLNQNLILFCNCALIIFLLIPPSAPCRENKSTDFRTKIFSKENAKNHGALLSQFPESLKQLDSNETSILPFDEFPSNMIPKREKDYIVGGADVLNIVVYDEPDLSVGKIRISRDGFVNYPLLGKIKLRGLTISEVETHLEDLLKDDYILNPQVSVLVVEYGSRKVFILGAVGRQGSYELKSQAALLEIIAMAGGISGGAGEKIIILRSVNGKSESTVVNSKQLIEKGDLSLNIFVKDHDTIYVPGADVIYLYGEIRKPGPYKLTKHNTTVFSAINLAGGFTATASPKKTRIIRVVDGEVQTIYVNVDAIVKKGDKEKDIKLMPEDVLIVPETLF